MKRALLVGLVAATLALGNGCCQSLRSPYGPFGPGMRCDSTHCGSCGECDSCGGPRAWDTGPGALAGRRAWAVESDCGSGCSDCGECGDPCECDGACGYPCGPLTWVASLFDPGCWDGGCGERYWGECSDPPDCCDPCDRWGNYTGGPCGGCGEPMVGSGMGNRVMISEMDEQRGVPTRAGRATGKTRLEPIEDPYALRRVPTHARR